MNSVKTLLSCLLLATLTHATHAAASVASGLPASSYSADASYPGYPPANAFNGGAWNAGGFGTHWIQVDLGIVQPLVEVSFVTSQLPNGVTWQNLYLSDAPIGPGWSSLAPAGATSGFTANGTPISFSFGVTSARYLQIVANGGPSWTALANINVVAAIPEPQTYLLMLGGLMALAAFTRGRRALFAKEPKP